MNDQAEGLRRIVRASSPKLSQTRLTVVTGGRPGVGATTIAYHTAARLADEKCRVAFVCGVVDLIQAGMVQVDGVDAFALSELPDAQDPLSHARTGQDGIAIFVATPDSWEAFGRHLIRLNGWFDHVVVDAGIACPWTAELPSFADATLLVAVPGGRSLSGLYGELAGWREKDGILPKAFLIVNRAQTLAEGVKAGRRLSDAARTHLSLDVPAVGCVLEDPFVAQSFRDRNAAPVQESDSPAGRCLFQVARNLERHRAFTGTSAGFLNLWRRFGSES